MKFSSCPMPSLRIWLQGGLLISWSGELGEIPCYQRFANHVIHCLLRWLLPLAYYLFILTTLGFKILLVVPLFSEKIFWIIITFCMRPSGWMLSWVTSPFTSPIRWSRHPINLWAGQLELRLNTWWDSLEKWNTNWVPLIYRVCIFQPCCTDIHLSIWLSLDISKVLQTWNIHNESMVALETWSSTAMPYLVNDTTIYPVVQSRNLGWIFSPFLSLTQDSIISCGFHLLHTCWFHHLCFILTAWATITLATHYFWVFPL